MNVLGESYFAFENMGCLLNSPNAPLTSCALNSLEWSLAKERLSWTLSNFPPLKNGNPLSPSKVFDYSSGSRTSIANLSPISPMLLPHLTSSPGKTNCGPGPPSNNIHLTPSRLPFPLGPFCPFPMLLAHSQSWLTPLYSQQELFYSRQTPTAISIPVPTFLKPFSPLNITTTSMIGNSLRSSLPKSRSWNLSPDLLCQ